MLNNVRKQDLKTVAEELDLIVPAEAKVIEMKSLIENADIFKNDPDFVWGIVKEIVEDQKNRASMKQSEIELERVKLARLEKEIELENLKPQASEIANGAVVTDYELASLNLENIIKSVKTLTIAVPERPEALHLFFQSLEKAFNTKNVPVKLKSEVLINLLGDKCNNV